MLLAGLGLGMPVGPVGTALTDIAFSDDYATAIVAQADGKVVIAGKTSLEGNSDIALVRYNADGTLDESFGEGGRVVTDLGSAADGATAAAVDSQGRIVVAGQCNGGRYRYLDVAVARYLADGTLDPAFGNGGIVTTDFGGQFDQAFDLILQEDGKILVGGLASIGGGRRFAVIRYDSQGYLDTTFGTWGKTTTAFPGGDAEAYSMVLQADGRILLGGTFLNFETWENDLALARYNPDGTLDTSYGNAGVVVSNLGFADEAIRTLAMGQDGNILAGGRLGDDMAVLSYTPGGALDQAFGGGGTVRIDVAGESDSASAMLVQHDGGILLAGRVTRAADSAFALARVDGSGQVDTAFGDGGVLVADAAWWDDAAAAVTMTPTGLLVAAGFVGSADGHDFAAVWYRIEQSNHPPSAEAGGAYSVEEGGQVGLSAAASSDPDGAIVLYEWDYNYGEGQDFTADAVGLNPVFSAASLDGPVTVTVALRVTDDQGASAISLATIAVTNVAPLPELRGPASAVRGGPLTLVGSFTDPGAIETYQVMWDFGDGSVMPFADLTDPGMLVPVHAYQATGTYTIQMTVRDSDGAVATASWLVSIQAWQIQPNAADPTKSDLVIGGTPGNDLIVVKSMGRWRGITVSVNSETLGVFNPTGQVIIYGQQGNDRVRDCGVPLPVVLADEPGGPQELRQRPFDAVSRWLRGALAGRLSEVRGLLQRASVRWFGKGACR